MLRFFFHRFSARVLIAEAAGVFLLGLWAWRIWLRPDDPWHKGLLALVVLEYAFIRLCASRRWYRGAPRWSGIELQFKKAMVPTSYLLAVAGAALLFAPALPVLITAAALLGVVAHVNVILLVLHGRDRSELPVNAFSRKI